MSRALWVVGLWAALLTGIVVAWSPRYWAVSVSTISVSALVVARMVLARDLAFPKQTVLVAAIGAWGFLQIAVHVSVLPQLTVENSIVWGLGAVMFVMAAQILRDGESQRLFAELVLWSLTALAVIAMLQFYLSPERVFGIFPAIEGVTGTLLSANQFAAMMEIAAPIALWYMLDRNPLPGGLCYAMILAATFTAASRTGVILVCAELVVFVVVMLFTRRRKAKAYLAAFGGLALVVAMAAGIAGTDRIQERLEEKNPYAVRRELFDSTRKLIAERRWTGWGMGTWRAVYPKAATFDMALLANEAHNDWAQWTSDGGIGFLVLMAGLVVWVARPAAQSMWGLGVLSVMAHSYVDYPIREPALSFLWFAMAGAVTQFSGKRSGSRRRRHASDENET